MIKYNIGGRLIIPIRAIPEVTGRDIPPNDIARILAQRAVLRNPKEPLDSYQCEPDGAYYPILPRDWDGVIADLVTLRNKLDLDQELEDWNHPTWREESTKRLLPGTFAWWDEFETFHAELFPERITELLDGRPGDRDINENPPLSPNIRKLISEGFEPLHSDIDSVAKEETQQAEENPMDSALEVSNLPESTRIEVESHIEKKAKEESKTPKQVKHSPETIKRYARWQAEADRFWAMRRHMNKGKCAIAHLIEKLEADPNHNIPEEERRSWDTIRHQIHKKVK